MNFLAQFLTAVCASCIFIGALHILCPKGSMSRSVRFALSLVFVVSLVAACGFIPPIEDIDLSPLKTEAVSGEEGLMVSAEYVYSLALQRAGINFSKVTVLCNKTQSDSISISKVIIVSSESEEKIRAALKGKAQDIEVEVRYE